MRAKPEDLHERPDAWQQAEKVRQQHQHLHAPPPATGKSWKWSCHPSPLTVRSVPTSFPAFATANCQLSRDRDKRTERLEEERPFWKHVSSQCDGEEAAARVGPFSPKTLHSPQHPDPIGRPREWAGAAALLGPTTQSEERSTTCLHAVFFLKQAPPEWQSQDRRNSGL